MSGREATTGSPEDHDDPEVKRPIESGRSATEEEREDPTRAPSTGATKSDGSAENTAM